MAIVPRPVWERQQKNRDMTSLRAWGAIQRNEACRTAPYLPWGRMQPVQESGVGLCRHPFLLSDSHGGASAELPAAADETA